MVAGFDDWLNNGELLVSIVIILLPIVVQWIFLASGTADPQDVEAAMLTFSTIALRV